MNIARTSGTMAKRRKLASNVSHVHDTIKVHITHPTVSPHDGSVPSSHMKLPTKAQIADMNKVIGMKRDVANNTGLTNTVNSMMWA